jgi:glycosyltransferase involved in cell wall biosynthesis
MIGVAAQQRILFIDAYPPMPDRNSGGLRTVELLRLLLGQGNDVTFLAQDVLDESGPYLRALEEMGIPTAVAPPHKGAQGFLPAGIATQDFDTVIIAFYTTAVAYLPTCRVAFPDAHLIIDTIDLHFLREQRAAEVVGDATKAAKAERTRREELAVYAQADTLWAITPVEQYILRQEVTAADVAVVPNVHQVERLETPFQERSGLVFVGNFWHPPNTEAMVWFCHDILPQIRAAIPDVETTIVGANAQAKYFTEFATQGVRLAGWVPDLHDVLGSARLSIAPLLHGAGMKGKVGEALSSGLPVVTTSIGSEGMGLTHGVNVLVADNGPDFAAAVVEAYSDPSLWNHLSSNGFGFMQALYTPAALDSVVRAAVVRTDRARYVSVPDWTKAHAVKAALEAYIRRYAPDSPASLHIAVVDHDLQAAADLLTQWVTELGYDVDNIPDIELSAMTLGDALAKAETSMWLSMGTGVPEQVRCAGALFPAHTV